MTYRHHGAELGASVSATVHSAPPAGTRPLVAVDLTLDDGTLVRNVPQSPENGHWQLPGSWAWPT